jgi:cephalosporin hydroxylase
MENKQLPRVTFSRGEKINLKRLDPKREYESIDVFVSVSIDLDDDMVKAVADMNKAAPTLVAGLLALVDQQKAEIQLSVGKPTAIEEKKDTSSVKKNTWKPRT